MDVLKMLIDLAFLVSTLRLFHLFKQCGENVLLKCFVLDWIGLIMEADTDLRKEIQMPYFL